MAKKRILVVEDDASILKMTKLRLENEGYAVLLADDGERAIKQVTTALPIDLILLDVKLPKLSGYEVCRQLKNRKATANIPVLVFTASEVEAQHLADLCMEVGANDWLKKPFRAKELLEKIHQLIGKAQGNGVDV